LIDLKGFGLSDRPRDGRYSVNDQAEIIKSFILQKNLENITIVGHSLGGAVALFTYFKVNPRIKALVLLNCATYPESMPRFLKVLRIPIINNFFSALIPTRLAVKKILKKSFYNDAKITEELVSAYTFYSSLPGSGYVSRRTAEQIVPDNIFELLQRLREITAPVFLLWGYDDEVIPLAYGLKLLHAIPGSRLVSLRQCGHIPPEEKPSDTVAEMGRFLESLPKNAGAVGQQPW
jgi:pimeloyl-ACP methyl ester carboxylesterase